MCVDLVLWKKKLGMICFNKSVMIFFLNLLRPVYPTGYQDQWNGNKCTSTIFFPRVGQQSHCLIMNYEPGFEIWRYMKQILQAVYILITKINKLPWLISYALSCWTTMWPWMINNCESLRDTTNKIRQKTTGSLLIPSCVINLRIARTDIVLDRTRDMTQDPFAICITCMK
jgi:hypothetical protein